MTKKESITKALQANEEIAKIAKKYGVSRGYVYTVRGHLKREDKISPVLEASTVAIPHEGTWTSSEIFKAMLFYRRFKGFVEEFENMAA